MYYIFFLGGGGGGGKQGWGLEKPICREALPKKGGLGQFVDLRGGAGDLAGKRG